MFLLPNSLKKFYAVTDAPAGAGAAEESKEETFELLNQEEEVQEEEKPLDLEEGKKEKKEKEKEEGEGEEEGEKEEEIDELKEIEDELKAPKEEDLNELVTPVRRREILAKYPKLFKDFPYLEKAYYREQQFTETFPTIEDARIASEKARILDQTEQQIMNGDISAVLQAAKSENQDAFYKIADNYLHTLRNVDQQAYFHVLGNVIKDTIITMVQEGRALGQQGQPLEMAANILNQFIFGSQTFRPPTNLSRKQDPQQMSREEQFRREDETRALQQFTSVKDDLQSRADNVLKATINGHIDPNGAMSDYVKGHASQEAFNTLEDLIARDTRFRSLLDKLWEKAFESGFDKASTDRIKSAYLSKAKTLLPSVIKKARNDALRGAGSRSRSEEKEEEQEVDRKGPVTPGKSTSPSSGKIRKASDIPRGMSTLDVLMKD